MVFVMYPHELHTDHRIQKPAADASPARWMIYENCLATAMARELGDDVSVGRTTDGTYEFWVGPIPE